MLEKGCTPSTVREVFSKLGGVMQIACEHGHLSHNAVRDLRKPRAEAGEEVVPLTPIELERLILSLGVGTVLSAS